MEEMISGEKWQMTGDDLGSKFSSKSVYQCDSSYHPDKHTPLKNVFGHVTSPIG